MVGLKTSSDSHQSSRREFNLVANSRLGLVLLLLLAMMAKNTRILWNVRLIALLATKTTITGRDWNLPQSKCVCVASHPQPSCQAIYPDDAKYRRRVIYGEIRLYSQLSLADNI